MLFVLLCTAVAEMLSLISLTFMSSVFINVIFITFSPHVVDVVKCPWSNFYFYLRHFNIDYFSLHYNKLNKLVTYKQSASSGVFWRIFDFTYFVASLLYTGCWMSCCISWWPTDGRENNNRLCWRDCTWRWTVSSVEATCEWVSGFVLHIIGKNRQCAGCTSIARTSMFRVDA